jgi:PilZ domain
MEKWQNNDDNRRKTSRFPIVREIRYRMATRDSAFEAGVGATINISSGGVYFTTEKPLLPGRRVELAISWPAELDRTTALKLVARGRVIRVEHGRCACEIQSFEFRTMGAGLGVTSMTGPKGSVLPFRAE